MRISRAAYYYQMASQQLRQKNDMDLRAKIEQIHVDFPGYGYRRVREHLLREGIRVNGKRIRRVMKTYLLFSSLKRLFRPKGARIGKKLVYPNLIRGMKVTRSNQLWATDITYIRLVNEFVYLSAIIDVYTRKIVGWAVSRDIDHKFCLEALRVALRRCKSPKGVIHHSDRGTQYCSEEYVKFLEKYKFKISMSRVRTPEDNAFIEAFFKTLKREEIYARNYLTMDDVLKNLPRFIDQIYNTKRLHSSLGYRSPEEYEAHVLSIKPAKRPVQKIWGWAV